MKKIFLFILCTIVSQLTFSQSFEGKIIYQTAYQSKNPNVSDAQWVQMMGSRQDYYIKGRYYKSVSNGSMSSWQLFNPDENRLYTKMVDPDVAFWNDANINPDSVLEFEINKKAADVLGYKCDELILKCTSGTQKYYFTSKLPINPEDYANHSFGNWSYFVSISKSLPLKIIIETEYFISTSTALEVSKEVLDLKMFEMDPNVVTQKSPY